jgi:hypothetical protein
MYILEDTGNMIIVIMLLNEIPFFSNEGRAVGIKPDPNQVEPTSDSGAQGVDLTPHPILDRITKKGEPSEVVVVVGFLGATDDTNLVRIYLDLSLRAYLEVPVGKVLYVEKFDPSDETQPTRIIVASDCNLKFVQTFEASFITGSIVSANPTMPPAATGGLGVAPGRIPEIGGGSPCVSPVGQVIRSLRLTPA